MENENWKEIKCLYPNHEYFLNQGICFKKDCSQHRLVCFQCLLENHQGHLNNIKTIKTISDEITNLKKANEIHIKERFNKIFEKYISKILDEIEIVKSKIYESLERNNKINEELLIKLEERFISSHLYTKILEELNNIQISNKLNENIANLIKDYDFDKEKEDLYKSKSNVSIYFPDDLKVSRFIENSIRLIKEFEKEIIPFQNFDIKFTELLNFSLQEHIILKTQ